MIKSAQSLVKAGDRFFLQHKTKNFHLHAAELLQKAELHKKIDIHEIMKTSFSKNFPQPQNFANFEFSDLPLTIARGKHCFIDLYFWRRRPTVIHNHHFTGAFQCLMGNNVDFEFSFKETQKLGKHHAIGELKIQKSHIVKAGDIQPIAPLSQFIHQNHHHADLTINLCFRTSDIKKESLSNYLYSGFRYEKNSLLLQRVERLLRFTGMGEVKYKEMDLSIDDALSFLIRTDGIESQNKSFNALRNHFKARVKKETRLNITKLFDIHEAKLEKIQAEYD